MRITLLAVGVVGIAALVAWSRCGGAGAEQAAGSVDRHAPRAAVKREVRTVATRAVTGRVVDGDRAGIAGAIVAFAAAGDRRVEPELWLATAQGDGSWAVGVPAGRYVVAVSAVGYRAVRRPIEITDRSEVIELALERGGTTVRGVVEDLGGGPIAGARVTFHGEVGRDSERDAARIVAVTGADGHYAVTLDESVYTPFYGIGPSIAATAQADGYTRRTRGFELDGRHDTVDFRLVPGGAIRGRVVTADGKPCRDPVVTAIVARERREQTREVIGDADGQFVVDELEPGDVTLAAASEGCTTIGGMHVELTLGGRLDDVRVVAERGYSIRGTVMSRGSTTGVAGVRIDATDGLRHVRAAAVASDAAGRFAIHGLPAGTYVIETHGGGHMLELVKGVAVAGADVELRVELTPGRTIIGRVVGKNLPAEIGFDLNEFRADSAPLRRAAAVRTTSDASGAFTLAAVPDGDFVLAARSPDGRIGKVTLAVTGDRTDVVIALAATGEGVLAGRVVDETGAAVGGARVQLFSPPHWRDMRYLLTAADGTFRATGLPTGPVDVDVAGRVPATGKLAAVAGSGDRTETFVVRARDGVVRGRVVDPSGAPARDVWVAAGEGEAFTDRDGGFEIIGLPRGSHDLRAHTSRGDARAEVTVETGTPATVKLEPVSRLAVRVTHGGAPVRGYRLECTLAGGRSTFMTNVDRADGTYRSSPLPPGPVTCTVAGLAGRATASGEVGKLLELALRAE